ncbi:hypothetical protein BB560_000227 [Smittium megazygosporum]|uniref:Uncharacterized protein n=1 Tax=Smittium megazygosporum TaxID=133381 RepID=A0A2T9ZKW5_9FUNG|nr:hypothetical protein BB560_000227 [Smittium megazygosporum]
MRYSETNNFYKTEPHSTSRHSVGYSSSGINPRNLKNFGPTSSTSKLGSLNSATKLEYDVSKLEPFYSSAPAIPTSNSSSSLFNLKNKTTRSFSTLEKEASQDHRIMFYCPKLGPISGLSLSCLSRYSLTLTDLIRAATEQLDLEQIKAKSNLQKKMAERQSSTEKPGFYVGEDQSKSPESEVEQQVQNQSTGTSDFGAVNFNSTGTSRVEGSDKSKQSTENRMENDTENGATENDAESGMESDAENSIDGDRHNNKNTKTNNTFGRISEIPDNLWTTYSSSVDHPSINIYTQTTSSSRCRIPSRSQHLHKHQNQYTDAKPIQDESHWINTDQSYIPQVSTAYRTEKQHTEQQATQVRGQKTLSRHTLDTTEHRYNQSSNSIAHAPNKYFWIDITDPTTEEIEALSQAFFIHPLTVEDIESPELANDKVDNFGDYTFITYGAIDDQENEDEKGYSTD